MDCKAGFRLQASGFGLRGHRLSVVAIATVGLIASAARGQEYEPGDRGQAPRGSGVRLLPEQFLRGYDPITAYFPADQVNARGAADDGAARLKISPAWPGAWSWADGRTLQFRPAEPWPALARFAIEAGGARRVLATMMSAPQAMSPAAGSDDLRPFRMLTLTFPQALALQSLRQMLRLDLADLPGLGDAPRRNVQKFALAQLPRGSQRDPAVYAITLDEDVPEGKLLLVSVSLALGGEDKVLWTGRLSTNKPFHLMQIACGNGQADVAGGGQLARDLALSCGSSGEGPQLVFSAPPSELSLTQLKRLVQLEPSVPDLHHEVYGSRVTLKGRFRPDTLYKLRLTAAPLTDDSGRALQDPRGATLFFYLGFKSPFLRFSQATAILESHGPRMVPAVGHGEARADVRIYRIDPTHAGLWPFPDAPLVIDEESAPPFPGEEPKVQAEPYEHAVSRDELLQHIRLLGSPLVSKVVELPIAGRGGTARFGLDLPPLLDPVVGLDRPGTYLVGLRRLTGPAQRAYVRVQITNLSLTAVEERDRALLYVRTLDDARAVRGARIALEGKKMVRVEDHLAGLGYRELEVPAVLELVTDGAGGAELGRLKDWTRLLRVVVRSGDDALVIDPREPPPRFASNHWSPSSIWLTWLFGPPPASVNDKLIGFVFTERPIYRPGEKVSIKGYVRSKTAGELASAGPEAGYGLEVRCPDGSVRPLPLSFTPSEGFAAGFQDKTAPTGFFTAVLFKRLPHDDRRDVAQRTFQIEAYRIPTFEVQLSGAAKVRLDQPFKVKAVARYYAGGAAAGLKVQWVVTRRPSRHVPTGREGFLFASSSQFARQGSQRAPETIRREGKLDDEGAAEITINPALDVDGSARVYRFEATITGPDEQQISAAQETTALPPFVLGLKLQRYAKQAIELKPQIIALGVDGKAIAGQEVLVRLYRRLWHSHLRETNFAAGEARYVTEQEDQKLLELPLKTSSNPVTPTLPIKEAGVYIVELFARDKLGRVQTISADLYVGGAGKVAWQKPKEGVFNLATDKKSYRPGELAKVIVQSPYQTAQALIVVEEPKGNRYHWIPVEGGKAVFELPIGRDYVPNLPIHAVLLRGRVGESRMDDARHRPQTVAASLDVEVEPVQQQLKVKLAHPEAARPGTTVNLEVSLADERGKPLSGEVTLWLVDEAVLSLAKEGPLDPLSAFIERNQRVSSVRDTRNLVVGRVAEDEEPGGDGSNDEASAGRGRKRVVRKTFQTVPFYLATLFVDGSGKATAPVKLSDDLTTFRVRAVAASGLKRFGYAQTTLRVRLPLIVQPQLPRFVRQGDKFWAGGVGRLLEGAEGPASVSVELGGALEGRGGQTQVDLKTNKPVSVLVPVTARATGASEPGEVTIKVDVTRGSDGVGDAFEVKLPLLPDRTVERTGYFARLTPGETRFHPLPEAARPGTAVHSLLFTSVPGVIELAAGLDYLSSYPHGCLEQKLSQVSPYVVHAQLLRRLGLAGRPRAAAGPKVLLDDLSQYQDEAGLFGYWPGSTGDVALTAQVLSFVEAAKRVGLKADSKVELRAIEAMQKILRSDSAGLRSAYRYNQQTSALRSLALAGRADEHYLIDLFHARSGMDTLALADLAVVMAGQPRLFDVNLKALRTELWDRVVFQLRDGKPTFQGVKAGRAAWAGSYLASSTGATAATFEALTELDPTDDRLGLLRDGVLSLADAVRGFGSTYDNRRAIEAISVYLDKAKTPALKAGIGLSTGQSLLLSDEQKVSFLSVPSDQALTARVSGAEVAARIAVSYLPDAPGDRVASLSQGFLVARGATVYRENGTQRSREEDHGGATLSLKQGEIVEVDATVTTDEDRSFVAVVIPFAAGLEPMNAALEGARSDAKPSREDSTRATYVQRADEEVRYYFDALSKGTHTFHFRLRAASEGSFVHPAPYAELMYQQEVRGRGEGMRVVVTGSHQK